jgi:hypothetical protein
MQTTAPTLNAITRCASVVHPIKAKIKLVSRSVVIVIPETGFEDDPIRPTILEDTVTKKKENITMRNATSRLEATGISVAVQNERTHQSKRARITAPPMTINIDKSLLVLG